MDATHTSVMPSEVREFLAIGPGKRYIDGTLGAGGHAAMILAAHPDVEVLGIDRDREAIEEAARQLERFGQRLHLRRAQFSRMAALADALGWRDVHGVVLDVGVSSRQLDQPQRGFSYRQDGPLDMRMDRGAPITAAQLLNTADEDTLRRIFRDYGEERRARQVARAVVRRRQEAPWARTGEFAELVAQIVGRSKRDKSPAPTRCFQALRIAVNEELDELQSGLEAAVEILAPGGRLVVISFHSLEDRIVKQFFRESSRDCVCPPDFPACRCTKVATLKVLTRKPVRPMERELAQNRRAAPAKLRAAEKLASARSA